MSQLDTRLSDLTNCLFINEQGNVAVRTGFSGNINITGNVNIPSRVKIESSSTDPVVVSLTTDTVVKTVLTTTSTVEIANTSLSVVQAGLWDVTVTTGTIFVRNFTSTVRVSSLPNITGVVQVNNFTSTVNVKTLPTVYGHVTALPVSTTGTHYSYNNNQSPTIVDQTMRPLGSFSISTNSTLFNRTEIVDIQFYSSSPIVYEIYEGAVVISDPIPPSTQSIGSWTTVTRYTDAVIPAAGSTADTSSAQMRTSGLIKDIGAVNVSGVPIISGGSPPGQITILGRALESTATLYFSLSVKELEP